MPFYLSWTLFLLNIIFCCHSCYPLWTSSPFSQVLPIRIGMTHAYKLQTWVFKPETVRLVFCLISSSMSNVCPGCQNGCLPLPLYTPRQPCAAFWWEGQGVFFLNYFLTPWVRFSCSWWQCCSTVVKSRQGYTVFDAKISLGCHSPSLPAAFCALPVAHLSPSASHCPGGRSGNEPFPQGEVLGMPLSCLGLEGGLVCATEELCTERGVTHTLPRWDPVPFSPYRQYQVL